MNDEGKILKAGNTIPVSGNTFEDIQDSINLASSGDTILLSGTYYGNGNQIYVTDKQISIIGNEYTLLDAGGLSRILGVIDSDNVIIKNLNFANGNGSNGGAVYVTESADCNIENCTFINNSAYAEEEYYDSYGGAVYVIDSADCIIENCTFINNSACGESVSHGGAVYVDESVGCIIENCTFINNSAYVEWEYYRSYGGAVYISSFGIIENCTFINNSAYGEGEYCNSYGGAVYISSYGYCIIENCTFINNSACGESVSQGGAVYWRGNNGFLNDSKFVNNSAIEGCDVFWSQDDWDDTNSGTLANSYFANYNSSSIYVGEKINVINITQDKYHTLTELKNLIDAAADEITLENDYAYVLDNRSGILINKNLKINGNGHIIDGMNVANIFNVSEGYSLTIDNVIFKHSFCAIESMGILNISNSQFIGNGIRRQISEYEYILGTSIISSNKLILSNCNFSEGIKDIFANGSGLIENCIFRDITYNPHYEWYKKENCLELHGNISLLNCTFHDNKLLNVNLISLYDNVSIMDSKFINNTVSSLEGESGMSTIMSNGENKIINCDFINCSSPGDGAAISIKSYLYNCFDEDYRWDNVLIKDCRFINCNSFENGGAVAVRSSCYYDYDTEECTKFHYSNVTIVNCTFKNNEAGYGGGAIYIDGSDDIVGICAVINSTFLDNQASFLSNDIYNMGNLSLSGNTMTKDFATIYNAYYTYNAMITSPVSLEILDNSTKKALIDNPFVIYAQLVDDNGNLIEDDRISLQYGSTQENLFYNNRNGLFEDIIYDLSSFANETLVSGTYDGAKNLNVKTAVISLISSVEPSVVNATIDLDYLDENVIIKLKDLDGNPLSDKSILVSTDNFNSSQTTDSNGEVRIQITENTTVKAVYTDDLGASVSASLAVKIIENTNATTVRSETQIIYSNMNTVAVDVDTDGRVGKYFYITLKDKNGNALANKPVSIGFNGNVYNRMTDKDGKASLQINLKNAGTYTFAVAYLGDDKYNGSFVVAKIVVSKQKGSLTVPAKSYKASAKTKSLTATFKSASGKVVKGKKITFTVNGKTYTATTNAKGVATVKVSLNKKGTYKFTAKFAGNNMYAAMTKTAKLTIK